MFGFGRLFFIFFPVVYTVATFEYNAQCEVSMTDHGGTCKFNCMGLTSLNEYLKKAPANTTDISVVNSELVAVPRHSFTRFGATLKILDLHKCGITAIDVYGFAGLGQLKKLVLWENNLSWIVGEWFRNLANLRHLDISFNQILGIDSIFYQMLPNLENFYFDYNQMKTVDSNMFPLLGQLKKVKFGKNPWNWGSRILLTWQLDNQRVDYHDDWEEWGWMNTIMRECQDSGQGSTLNDTILDCAILKFLQIEVEHSHNISGPETEKMKSNVACLHEATALIQCSVPLSLGRKSIRRTFEGLTTTLKIMSQSNGNFYYGSFM